MDEGMHSQSAQYHHKKPVDAMLTLAQKICPAPASHKRKMALMKNSEIVEFVENVGIAFRKNVLHGSAISSSSV